MRNRSSWIILGVVALIFVLLIGAAGGAALTYYFLDARPARAAVFAANELGADEGVLISHVVEGSAAAEAGLVRGDILLEVNGQAINSLPELWDALADLEPEDTITLTVQHGDDLRTLETQLGERGGEAFLGVNTCVDPFNGGTVIAGPWGKSVVNGFAIAGAKVIEVVPDSPAEAAGLQVGDVITAVDGVDFGEQSLADLVQSYQPGDKVTLDVISQGEKEAHQVEVTLGEDPDEPGQAYLGIQFRLGANLPFSEGHLPSFFQKELEGQLPEDFGEDSNGQFFFHGNPNMPDMPFGHGTINLPEGITSAAIIGEVLPDTPAAEAGLQAGDVVYLLNGEQLDGAEGLVAAISAHKPGDEVTLNILRDGEQIEVTVTLAEHPDNPDAAYLGVMVTGFVSIEAVDPSDMPNWENDVPEFELPGVPGGDA